MRGQPFPATAGDFCPDDSISFEREFSWSQEVGADQLESAAVRVGGMLLLMGILHGLNVISLPIIGRLLGLGRTLEEDTPEPKAA